MYVGFALHFFGECYGRTQSDLARFQRKAQSKRCIGDQTYTTCKDEHKECVGAAYAEYVYKLDFIRSSDCEFFMTSWILVIGLLQGIFSIGELSALAAGLSSSTGEVDHSQRFVCGHDWSQT